ncbi:Cof-type HAD-IIB family hydrolase [Metabacillus arenae]|uniref:Cof-type HAD-IIB family hydrolase n=1 Tax=Metabacillus arenae TaxID=2771434 RepID=A0A926N7T0_9BACI|nr:Cof-type HAD-IIB family hydrolase [Metabacillus arenae]MBD1378952.1 Cof-type HAD-IIB family hydrolase [Metabacillus arenae]
MKSIKIAFFDIDGTIFNHNTNSIAESTIEAIQALNHKGIKTIISTGRTRQNCIDVAEKVGITNFINVNGNYVTIDEKVIHKTAISLETLKKFDEFARSNNHCFYYCGEMDNNISSANHPYTEKHFNQHYLKQMKSEADFHLKNEVLQIALLCEHEYLPLYHPQFNDLTFKPWISIGTDIFVKGQSKAKGIEKVLAYYNFHADEAIAFGDGVNDIEMLQYVGTGIAMGNANDEVKSAANIVAKSIDEDGIFHSLKQLSII